MDKISQKDRSITMKKVHSKDTTPEKLVRSFLFSKGLRFRKNDKRYPGHPDIVLPKYKSIVFVNGCFWHLHDNCKRYVIPKSNTSYWLPKLNQNKIRDQEQISKLKAMGWRVFIVWECELIKSKRSSTLKKLYNGIVSVKSEVRHENSRV